MDAARNLLDDFEEKANTDEQWAIINAGGVGTRFWPVGYKYKPKQLLEFAKGKGSLLQMTVERQINKRDPNSISPKKVLIITNKDIEEQVYLQVKKYDIPRENIIGEPIGLNTGPALRVGALIVEEKAGPNAIIRSLHADHIIPDSIAFNKVLAKCANFAKLSNSYVEIGVTPSKELDGKFTVNPKLGHHVIGKNIYGGIHFLLKRVEKEEKETYEATFQYYKNLIEQKNGAKWNSGCVVVRAGLLSHMMKILHPNFEKIFQEYKSFLNDEKKLLELYLKLKNIKANIPHDIMFATPATKNKYLTFDTVCATGLAKENWDDVGNLLEARRMNKINLEENFIVSGNIQNILFEDCKGNTIYSSNDGTKIFLHRNVDHLIVAYEKGDNSLLVLQKEDAMRGGEVPKDIESKKTTTLYPYIHGKNVPETCDDTKSSIDENKNFCRGDSVIFKECSNCRFLTNKGLIAAINLKDIEISWDKDVNEIHIRKY